MVRESPHFGWSNAHTHTFGDYDVWTARGYVRNVGSKYVAIVVVAATTLEALAKEPRMQDGGHTRTWEISNSHYSMNAAIVCA